MIAPIDRQMNFPWSTEATAVNGSNEFNVTVPAGATTVISNVSSIHAHSVTVFVQVIAGALVAPGVTIRKYAANRTITVDANVIGVVAAPNSAAADSVLPVGQTYDIIVHTGAAATLRVWTCARSV
jgi:hypothetical protein